jgi:NADPH:quinone reductase-like Zn-dependent oxidoreductase
MRAIIYQRYGAPDVLRCEEIEKPTPGDDEVLIRVRAAAVNPLDWRLMRGLSPVLRLLFRMAKPTVEQPGRPGRDVAGIVEAVGRNVTRLKAGDAVFGTCKGSFAEYACASEAGLALKPDEFTFEQAASIPIAGLTAWQGLRWLGQDPKKSATTEVAEVHGGSSDAAMAGGISGVRARRKALINGASGGVGTFAVQIAKAFGADVTGVCSGRNAEMVRALGADRVIDYTREDFTGRGERYDLVLDNVGNLSLGACRRILNRRGIGVIAGAPKQVGGFLMRAAAAPVVSRFTSRKVRMFMAKMNHEDLSAIAELIERGKVRPVIDRCYELDEAAKAMQYVEEGHARGKVVISMEV